MALHNQFDDAAFTLLTLEENLTSPPPTPLPSLPLDLVVEILCRLPVKFLLRFRSVCKIWNSLISDPKFAKKHLGLSTSHNINSLSYSYSRCRYIFESYPLNSIFSTIDTNVTQLEYPPYGFDEYNGPNSFIVGSCNGIICVAGFDDHICFVLLWNPSIRKFKELPSLEKPKDLFSNPWSYGFGYDHVNDNYKVVVFFQYYNSKSELKVHTVGTNFWKSVEGFPLGCTPYSRSGTFLSGTINWLPLKDGGVQSFIVSFDLTTESYQEILLPISVGDLRFSAEYLSLVVLRECLCLIYYHDVWVMKEFGNTDSVTKFFTIMDPYKCNYYFSDAMYMFPIDQVLLVASFIPGDSLLVYDPETEITEYINFKNKRTLDSWPVLCVESLVSPCY